MYFDESVLKSDEKVSLTSEVPLREKRLYTI